MNPTQQPMGKNMVNDSINFEEDIGSNNLEDDENS